MANTITYTMESLETEVVEVTAAVVGNGAAIPTIPTSHSHVVASTTRSGVGTYIIQLKDRCKFPTLLGPVGQPCVIGTTGKKAFITAQDSVAGTIAIQAKDATDAAVDLAATDTLYMTSRFRNSKAKFGGAA